MFGRRIFFGLLFLAFCIGGCGDKPSSSEVTGQIVLEICYGVGTTAKSAESLSVDRMVARALQGQSVAVEKDLRREGGNWVGELSIEPGNYTVELEAHKGSRVKWWGETSVSVVKGKTSRAVVELGRIDGEGGDSNNLPIADAGDDLEIEQGMTAQLNGGGSSDPDGGSLTYRWIAPVGVALSDATDPRPTLMVEAPGEYRISLVVNDGSADSVPDEVVVTVKQRVVSEISTVNTPAGSQHEMVLVPEGEFTMGFGSFEAEDESPEHVVYLDAFLIDRYEVTNALWNAYARTAEKPEKSDPDDHPVREVNWYDANDYCEWAGLRLPTEAEWEKAARGTDGREYPWGNEGDAEGEKANFYNTGIDEATPVGNFPEGVSPYGAHDMAGNVYEWVADWYGEDYYTSSPGNNPVGPSSGEERVLRGGFWGTSYDGIYTFSRFESYPEGVYANIGFRCARDE